MTAQNSIINAVKNAGIVGAGGGGFPTHVKLGAKVDTVIANGSECEPLLYTDKAIMARHPDLIIRGLETAMKATGAEKGFIALKGHNKDVVDCFEKAIPQNSPVSLFLMDNYYPAGDEFLLVYDVTGRIIPEGGLPLEVGVLVSNVVTLMQVAKALDGVFVTNRAVTVAGAVNSPSVITAPIGTSYKDLINEAGGLNIEDAVLIDGGPMMGKVVDNINMGIGKTTSGVVALPKDHFVVTMKRRTMSQELFLSRAACCQCFRCTDVCPRNLMGHDLYPHMTMRAVNYLADEPAFPISSAYLCSQCGMCEMVGCDIMRLSPRRIYADLRQRLAKAGFKNPHRRKVFSVRDPYALRKMPIPALIKKINLSQFDSKPEFRGDISVSSVRVPLARHTGAPSFAKVKKGDGVKIGDLIGEVPEGKLGAPCHASISGKVTSVTNEYIEIAA